MTGEPRPVRLLAVAEAMELGRAMQRAQRGPSSGNRLLDLSREFERQRAELERLAAKYRRIRGDER